MKRTRLLVLAVLVIACVGCVRRLPAGEALAERFLVGVPPAETLVPLRVEAMIEPGLIPVRWEMDDGQKLLALFIIYWRPSVTSPEYAAGQVVEVTRQMFADRIFLPAWGEPVGFDEELESSGERLSWLVNSRLKVVGLDTTVELELVLVQVSVATTGEARYTWIKGVGGESK